MGIFSSLFGNRPPDNPPRDSAGQRVPGPSRGILARLREMFGGWPGPRLAKGQPAGDDLARERPRAGPPGIILPRFLPAFDDTTGETGTMRKAYRLMFADPNVKAALLGTVYGVASLDLQIHPASKTNRTDRTVADYIEWGLTRRLCEGMAGLVEMVLVPGQIDGYSLALKVWGEQQRGLYAGNYVLRKLKGQLTGDNLVLQTNDLLDVVGVMGLRYNAGQIFSPSDFLIYRHLPIYNTPTGTSALRAVYSRWWLLDTVLKLRAIAAEKRALGIPKGTYSNTAVKAALETALASLKSASYVNLPEGAEIELLNLAGEADAIFKSFCDDLREEIFLGIQFATLQALTGGAGEQRGSSKVQQSTSQLGIWRLATAIADLLNDEETGLIKDMVDLNYVVSEYPRATLSAVDPEELASEMQIDTGLVSIGCPPSKEEAYERYGRTPPKDDEDTPRAPGGGGDKGGPGAEPGAAPPGEEHEGQDGIDDIMGALGGNEPDDDEGHEDFGEMIEKKDKRGYRICYDKDGGKRLKCEPKGAQAKLTPARKAGPPPKPARAAKADPAALHDRIKQLLAKPHEVTEEQRAEVARQLHTLTKPQIHALRAKLGIKEAGQARAKKGDLVGKTAPAAAPPPAKPPSRDTPSKAASSPPAPAPAPAPAEKPRPAAPTTSPPPAKAPPSTALAPAKVGFDPALSPRGKEAAKTFGGWLRAAGHLNMQQKTAYFGHAQSVLKNMPDQALERMAKNITAPAVFAASTQDVGAAIIKLYEGTPKHDLVSSAVGNAEIGGCYARLDGQHRFVLDGEGSEKWRNTTASRTFGRGQASASGIYAHEMSHAIDGPNHELSNAADWQDAFAREIAGKQLNSYAASMSSEGWAEFGRLVYSGEHDAAAVQKRFPRCYAVWAKHGLLPDKGKDEGAILFAEDDRGGAFLDELFGRRIELPDGGHADELAGEAAQAGEAPAAEFGEPTDTVNVLTARPKELFAECRQGETTKQTDCTPKDEEAQGASHGAHQEAVEGWLARSNLPDEAKKEYAATAVAVLSKMPKGCRTAALAALSEKGGGVTFHADVHAVTMALEEETGKKERARVGGWVIHDPITGAVHAHLDGRAGASAGDTAEGIYAHELGHAVDAGRKHSESAAWQAAWKREIHNGKVMLSAYARTSATEGFAELHRAIVQKGVEATRTVYPKCVGYLAAKGLV